MAPNARPHLIHGVSLISGQVSRDKFPPTGSPRPSDSPAVQLRVPLTTACWWQWKAHLGTRAASESARLLRYLPRASSIRLLSRWPSDRRGQTASGEPIGPNDRKLAVHGVSRADPSPLPTPLAHRAGQGDDNFGQFATNCDPSSFSRPPTTCASYTTHFVAWLNRPLLSVALALLCQGRRKGWPLTLHPKLVRETVAGLSLLVKSTTRPSAREECPSRHAGPRLDGPINGLSDWPECDKEQAERCCTYVRPRSVLYNEELLDLAGRRHSAWGYTPMQVRFPVIPPSPVHPSEATNIRP